jgi:hypothetical protein
MNTGWFVWNSEGRGMKCKRPRLADLPAGPRFAESPTWRPQFELREMVLNEPELTDRNAAVNYCGLVTFDVYPDLAVYDGGACDTAGWGRSLPDRRDAFKFGRLEQGSLTAWAANYREATPARRALAGVTWGDLARDYGSSGNDELYTLNTVVMGTWARDYLRERLAAVAGEER